VTGFSVGGRVVDSEDTGLKGVKIEIDGIERATTDADGYYKLDQVSYLNPSNPGLNADIYWYTN
jgi:hypothetical protein